ncbi:MAG TPA: TadE family protein [Negativicutes bacterium]|jgi:Flp pilus assembly protein TadG
MLRQMTQWIQKQQGQALVEFFVVLPLLLFVFAGIVDIGRVYHQILLANGAVRDGVRRAAVGKSFADIQTAVQNYDDQFIVAVNPNPPTTGQPVTVTVTGSVTIITPIISTFFTPNPYPVRATATMQVE